MRMIDAEDDLIKAFELLKAHCKNRECNKDCVFYRELRIGDNIDHQYCGLCEIVASDDKEAEENMTNKEAIEYLKEVQSHIDLENGGNTQKVYDAIDIAIKALENERPTGEWIFDAEHSITIDMFKCSVCGSGGHVHFNYCPNCGAKMKEAEDGQV